MDELDVKMLIEQIHNEKDLTMIRNRLLEYHPYDLAVIFKNLEEEDRIKVRQVLNPKELADIFAYLDEEDTIHYLEEMNLKEGARVLTEMESDDAADILNEMEEEGQAESYLEVMDKENQSELSYLTQHEENTAGSVMSTNYIELDIHMDIREAMKTLVREADETEVIDPLFVCEEGKLKGIVALKDLIIARAPFQIDKLMDTNFIYSEVTEEISSVTKKIQDYDIYAMPILDNEKLVGIITIDDALDEVVDEITEDYERMAGVTNDIDEQTSIFKNMMKRIPWLVCLLVVSLLISNITSQFEDVIVQVTIFAFFQSLILDMAGNAGTQSLAVTVRSLGRHELDTKKGIRRHLGKEFLTVFVNGLILGILAFVTSFLFMVLQPNSGEFKEWLVAFIIAGSLSFSLIVTGMFGSLVPIFFHKIKIDPAVASGPLITTLSDTISILIYFGLATAFMGMIHIGGVN